MLWYSVDLAQMLRSHTVQGSMPEILCWPPELHMCQQSHNWKLTASVELLKYLSTTCFYTVFGQPPSQNILLSHNHLPPFFRDDHITSAYYTAIQWLHPLIWVLPVNDCQVNVQTDCKLVGVSTMHSQSINSRQGDQRQKSLTFISVESFNNCA